MEPVTRKRYTAEFKAQAVELVGLGKPVSEVAEEFVRPFAGIDDFAVGIGHELSAV